MDENVGCECIPIRDNCWLQPIHCRGRISVRVRVRIRVSVRVRVRVSNPSIGANKYQRAKVAREVFQTGTGSVRSPLRNQMDPH